MENQTPQKFMADNKIMSDFSIPRQQFRDGDGGQQERRHWASQDQAHLKRGVSREQLLVVGAQLVDHFAGGEGEGRRPREDRGVGGFKAEQSSGQAENREVHPPL